MAIMVYSLLWVMQDFVHQPYYKYNILPRPYFKSDPYSLRKTKISLLWRLGEVHGCPFGVSDPRYPPLISHTRRAPSALEASGLLGLRVKVEGFCVLLFSCSKL